MFPDTREPRCWFHKQSNVLSSLPKTAHPGALAAMKAIYNAEDIDKAQLAIAAGAQDYGAKYPRRSRRSPTTPTCCSSTTGIRPSTGRTCAPPTNSIESTFATVRLRTKGTMGPGSKAAGMAMAYKLIEAVQAWCRAVNAPHLVALVRAGALFHKGKLLERPVDTPGTVTGHAGARGCLTCPGPQELE
ncbi:transposase [Rhodococcus sp. NPDC058532]|uniref:transposase n=1 Tax=Rhodococcus sp. NPDC058532 TaxID=3346540 RepID=UPI0036693422